MSVTDPASVQHFLSLIFPMKKTQLGRVAFMSICLAMMSGCTIVDALNFSAGNKYKRQQRTTQCAISPSSCDYNGRYEPGEEKYAEVEARRMNLAEAERIRNLAL